MNEVVGDAADVAVDAQLPRAPRLEPADAEPVGGDQPLRELGAEGGDELVPEARGEVVAVVPGRRGVDPDPLRVQLLDDLGQVLELLFILLVEPDGLVQVADAGAAGREPFDAEVFPRSWNIRMDVRTT